MKPAMIGRCLLQACLARHEWQSSTRQALDGACWRHWQHGVCAHVGVAWVSASEVTLEIMLARCGKRRTCWLVTSALLLGCGHDHCHCHCHGHFACRPLIEQAPWLATLPIAPSTAAGHSSFQSHSRRWQHRHQGLARVQPSLSSLLMRACWSAEVSTTALMHTTLPFK